MISLILSRLSIKIYYSRVDYCKVLDNLKEEDKYKEFVRYCQVELDMMIDVVIMT